MSAVPETISPELALVCPELRQQALEALPERDPYAFIDDRPPLRRHPELDAFSFLADVTEEDDTVDVPPSQVVGGALYFLASLAGVLSFGLSLVTVIGVLALGLSLR